MPSSSLHKKNQDLVCIFGIQHCPPGNKTTMLTDLIQAIIALLSHQECPYANTPHNLVCQHLPRHFHHICFGIRGVGQEAPHSILTDVIIVLAALVDDVSADLKSSGVHLQEHSITSIGRIGIDMNKIIVRPLFQND